MDKKDSYHVVEPPMDSKLNGAIRAFAGIKDAMMIVHGRSCCHADNLLYRAMTAGHNEIRLTGGGLRLRDISTGGHQKLGLSLLASYKQFQPSFMPILVTSVPSMMGDDVEGVILKLKDTIPIPIIAFSCPGYSGNAYSGYEEALVSLCDYMTQEIRPLYDINLIGTKSDNPHAQSDMAEIKRMLKDQGITVNAVFTCDTFKSLQKAAAAGLNIVMAGDGLELAKKMEDKFQIPYKISPYPFGLRGSVEFLTSVTEALDKDLDYHIIETEKTIIKEKLAKVFGFLEGIFNLRAAIVGDSGRAFDLARFLNDELCLDVKLLAVTSINSETIRRQQEGYFERFLRMEDRLRLDEIAASLDVELMVGSSLEGPFCKENRIPLAKLFYPVIDKVFISDYPIAGFRGVVHLTELILNAVIGT